MTVEVYGDVSETDCIARDEVSRPLLDPEELGSRLQWGALSALYLWILEGGICVSSFGSNWVMTTEIDLG